MGYKYGYEQKKLTRINHTIYKYIIIDQSQSIQIDMSTHTMSLCILICTMYLVFENGESCLVKRVTVYVSNSVSGPIYVQCKFGDGGVVEQGKDFKYSFCAFTRELWYRPRCTITWGTKKKTFVAYKGTWAIYGDCSDDCTWRAKPDGIYLNTHKKFDWD